MLAELSRPGEKVGRLCIKAELIVPGDEREVLEKVRGFLKEHKGLYRSVGSWGRIVEAKIQLTHVRFGVTRKIAGIIAGIVATDTMDAISGDPRITVKGESTDDNRTKLTITTIDGVKPEAVEPLLVWLRENLAGS